VCSHLVHPGMMAGAPAAGRNSKTRLEYVYLTPRGGTRYLRTTRHLPPRSSRTAGEISRKLLRLAYNRDGGDIALYTVLHLDALIVSERALCFGHPPFAGMTDVFVIANSLFIEAVEDTVLVVSQILHPTMHVPKHFSLDFRS
jgi:hypothetical protein